MTDIPEDATPLVPPSPPDEGYGDEVVLTLTNGRQLRCDAYDNPAGASYVRVTDRDGNEIVYWSYPEWVEDPQLVMGAIFGAAKGEDSA